MELRSGNFEGPSLARAIMHQITASLQGNVIFIDLGVRPLLNLVGLQTPQTPDKFLAVVLAFLDGKFLGKIPNLGRTYSLKPGAHGTLWAGMQPLNEPTGSPGWVVKLDRKTGKILGYVRVNREGGCSFRGRRRRRPAHDEH